MDAHSKSLLPLAWRHVILNARCSWLPGDPRGFRSRHHRLHSSGDYHDPPPPGEHAGLHEWMKRRADPTIRFDHTLWPIIAEAMRSRLNRLDRRVLAIAVGTTHVHLLVELPDLASVYRDEIGLAKRAATESVKHALTGQLWASGGTFKAIADLDHQRATFAYITTQQRPAWVWEFRDGGRFVR